MGPKREHVKQVSHERQSLRVSEGKVGVGRKRANPGCIRLFLVSDQFRTEANRLPTMKRIGGK